MKYLSIITLVIFIFSCNSKKEKIEEANDSEFLTLTQDSIATENEENSTTTDDDDFVEYPSFDYQPNFGVSLIIEGISFGHLPQTEPDKHHKPIKLDESWTKDFPEYANIYTGNWFTLSYLKHDKGFALDKTGIGAYRFYWDCGDFDMITLSSTSNRDKPMVMIAGVSNMQEGIIKSHYHQQVFVNPDKPYEFSFEGVKYKLRAEGVLAEDWGQQDELTEDGRLNNGSVYNNYKLYLSSEGKEQLLLAIKSFTDKFVEIEFIGDLDGDGKPDFLFETATWYEDYHKMLFISSKADEDELVKYVASDGYSMAC